MFRSDGTPVRATLNVSFKQYKPLSDQLADPRRNSPDKTKRRVVSADDSIWLLANREYGDPRDWRLIARKNRIDDPRAIRPGAVLVVPPIDEQPEGVRR
jgi:nucleoid-associated protein YgaU